ncbi:MAG: SDR family NAD(P)-dependent oxidoreductase, partial [Myxococcota bacterium]
SLPRPELDDEPTPPTTLPLVGIDPDDALADLLAVVSAKTGYEVAELDPEFELEADLGIDTVKQAEILSDLTDRYGLERDESFRLSDYPTIRKLAGWIAQRRGGALSEDPTADDELERTESTHWPRVTADAETPRGAAPRVVSTAAQARASVTPSAAPSVAPSVTPSVAPSVTPSVAPAPRPRAGGSLDATLAELVAVVAEKTGYDPSDLEPSFELEADLGVDTVKQAEILSELTDRFGLPRDEAFRPADFNTLEKLAAYLHERRSSDEAAPADDGRVEAARASLSQLPFVAEEFDLSVGMSDEERVRANHVPLPPTFRLRRPVLDPRPPVRPANLDQRRVLVLGDTPLAHALRNEVVRRGGIDDGPHEVVIDAADDVMISFRRAKALDATRPRRWITVTRLGGMSANGFSLGRGFVDGARAGLTKSLGREWEGVDATVLDLHPSFDAATAAEIACDEIDADPRDRELFVDADRARAGVRLVDEAPPAPSPLPGRPVVLLTGGGRGITARVAVELARRGTVALALIGRSEVSDAPLDEKVAKEQIRAQLQLAGERVTPARVEAALSGLRRSDEVRRNLDQLRQLGASVLYLQADLADAVDVDRVVREVTDTLGAIDVVIHGAGVEESRQLKDKDEAAFHRVFDGKAIGGRVLLERVPESAYVVCMGSVAGRFGNPGQVDYAAANDALARMCHTRPNSLHVDWTAWDDVGMAVRGGMKSLLTDRGVDLLPADAGAAVLAAFVAAKTSGELVCAGRLGDFEPGPDGVAVGLGLDTIERGTGERGTGERGTGERGTGERGTGERGDGTVRATRSLSRATDGWIVDHAIDGVPLLPGVIGLELMAATAHALFPELGYRGARDVKFHAPVKVHRDGAVLLVIEAEVVGIGVAKARLVSERTLATGRVQRTDHFEATVTFGDALALDGLPSVFLPDETVDREQIYRRFFHGPGFQVLAGIFGVSLDGLVGEGRVDHGALGGEGLLTAPLVLEAAFQAAGLHRMITAHALGLPFELAEVQLFAVPDDGAPLSITAQLDGTRYHVDIDGVAGPVLRLRGFEMIEKGPVPPEDRFPEPDGGRPVCFPNAPRPTIARGTTIAEARADDDPTPWLTPSELGDLAARGTERRVRDRVAGRMAAKRALGALTGVDPLEIRVWTADSGEPIAAVPGHPDVRVSISHREGRAVAVAVAAGRVGVDLEKVEPRPESFGRTWFRDDEQALTADPASQTVGWAVKEAVLKWLGTGMKSSPHDVRIVAIGDGTAEVALDGPCRALHASLGGDPLVVTWATAGSDEVIVTVRSAA